MRGAQSFHELVNCDHEMMSSRRGVITEGKAAERFKAVDVSRARLELLPIDFTLKTTKKSFFTSF